MPAVQEGQRQRRQHGQGRRQPQQAQHGPGERVAQPGGQRRGIQAGPPGAEGQVVVHASEEARTKTRDLPTQRRFLSAPTSSPSSLSGRRA